MLLFAILTEIYENPYYVLDYKEFYPILYHTILYPQKLKGGQSAQSSYHASFNNEKVRTHENDEVTGVTSNALPTYALPTPP